MRTIRTAALVLTCLVSAAPLLAEPVTITGTVVGPDGQATEGARVGVSYLAPEGGGIRLTETTSAADGTYSLSFESRYDSGNWTVAAQADGYAFGWMSIKFAERVEADLTLAADPGMVRGRVLDAAGRPVPGAEVGSVRIRIKNPDGSSTWGRNPLLSATTDGEGSFALTGLPRRAVVSAAVDATGFARRAVELGVAGDAATAATIMLQPESVITGRVLRDGEPLAGVRVWIRAIRPASPEYEHATTDAEGRFTFTRLSATNWDLMLVSGQGLIARELEVDVGIGETVENADLKVVPGGMVEGTVTLGDTGKPAAGVIVNGNDDHAAKTREDGSYALLLMPGKYVVRPYPWGDARDHYNSDPAKRTVEVVAGETVSDMDFVMLRKPTYGGVCLDEEGHPVAGALVQVLIPDTMLPRDFKPFVTGEDGAFKVSPEGYISEDPWWIYARHEERNLAGVIQVADPTATATLRMTRGASVTAAFLDQAGEGVPNIRLMVGFRGQTSWGMETWFPGDSRSGETGEVTVGPLPGGLELTVMTSPSVFEYALDLPWETHRKRVRLLDGEELRLPTVTLLPEGWRVTGTVLRADGKPAAGAIVRNGRPRYERPPFGDYEYPSSVTADAQGRFAFPGLPRHCTLVVISADDTQAAAVRCQPTEQVDYEVRLAPPGSVVGVVYDADGTPVPDVKISYSPGGYDLPADSRFRVQISTRTDARGRYRVDGLIAGCEYSLGMKRFTAEGGEMPHVVDIYLEE